MSVDPITAGPPSEAERLRILAELSFVEAIGEPAFDALAVVAQMLLDVPIACVTAIDADTVRVSEAHRERGLPSPARSLSFSEDVVSTGRTLVVEDARANPRFSAHPQVTRAEGGLRFYVGIPLKASNGAVLGTLSGFDTRTREHPDPHKLEILENLARAAITRLELKVSEAELHRQEIALSRRNELVEATIQNIDQGIMVFDRDIKLVTCNQHAIDIVGFPADVFAPEFAFERACEHMVELGFYGDGDPKEIARTRTRALKDYRPSDRDQLFPDREVLLRDGRTIILRSVPLADCFLSTYRDVTAERSRALALKRNARYYELQSRVSTISNEAADVASALRKFVEYICVDLNYEIGRVSRLTEGRLMPVGLPYSRKVPAEDVWAALPEGETHLARRALETGEAIFDTDEPGMRVLAPLCGEARLQFGFAVSIKVPSETFVFEAYGPYAVSYGSLQMQLTCHLQAQLLCVAERERAQRVKEEFVSVISHELRTPLTSVSGMLDLLGSGLFGSFEEEAERLIDTGIAESRNLSQLVEDTLTIHRIEQGLDSVDLAPHGLATLVREAVEPYAERHPVVVDDEAGDLDAETDPRHFRHALGNLLANAVRSSPEGRPVDVEIRALPGWIRTSVTDHGAGIPEAFRDHLFDTSVQDGQGRQRRAANMGLGLPIAERLIGKLGGRLSFDTVVGRGTTFHVDLPLAARTGAAS